MMFYPGFYRIIKQLQISSANNVEEIYRNCLFTKSMHKKRCNSLRITRIIKEEKSEVVPIHGSINKTDVSLNRLMCF